MFTIYQYVKMCSYTFLCLLFSVAVLKLIIYFHFMNHDINDNNHIIVHNVTKCKDTMTFVQPLCFPIILVTLFNCLMIIILCIRKSIYCIYAIWIE